MPNYNFITLAQAQAALAARLNDPGMNLYVAAELLAYLTEALRFWNALTAQWNTDYVFTVVPPVSSIWTKLSGISGYPRQQTVLDTDVYKLIQYHFLEPATGGTWTGTPQFSISDLSGALQRRRDEIIQISACNPASIPLASTPNTRRVVLPDNVLELMRARFVPASGSPNTLWRDDQLGMEFFEPGYLQSPSMPMAYDVITGPPQSLTVDNAPNVPGAYDLIALLSGAAFSPPSSTLLGIPDDFSWVAKWGAMSDLLGSGSEKADPLRAEYCLQRYKDGLTLMAQAPWIVLAQLDGVAADTVSMAEMDAYSAEWDSTSTAPQCIVLGGTDLISVCPVPSVQVGVSLTVIGNAPIPANPSDPVQCSRDVIDVILDYAEMLCSFKKGGQEFKETLPLLKNFALAAIATNERLASLGLFRDILFDQGQRQIDQQPRFEGVGAEG